MAPSKPSAKAAQGFLDFVSASPTPFHAVANAIEKLEAAGFEQIHESEPWTSQLKPGNKYYLTRNTTSLIAFAVGSSWTPGGPIGMVGAHTDSPCLRIKPVSKRQSDGWLQVGVETYGGGLWHTWFDRDLSLAGRIMVKDEDGTIEQKLVKIERPILRIPTLAIHLDRQETFSFNKETQLFPIAGLVAAELNRQGKGKKAEAASEKDDKKKSSDFQPLKAVTERHHPYLVEVVAQEADVQPEAIQDFELLLYDTQKPCFGGLNNELIFSARLDNLMMSFCAVEGLISSLSESSSLKGDATIRLAALFDHEEIGSQTAQGAMSNLLPSVVRRLSMVPSSQSKNEDDADLSNAYEQTLSKSFLLSADMAHAVHPNYPAKYESEHRPQVNGGPVIKINANARYATNSPGIVLLQEVARMATSTEGSGQAKNGEQEGGVPLQLFVVRNDSSCGSTIGPMLSAALGARTLDLGNPQLSMHSIRETGGVEDVEYGIRLFSSFWGNYGTLSEKIVVD